MTELHAGCRLRPMRGDDLDVVVEIENATQPSPWAKTVFNDCLRGGYDCQVIERDRIVIGFQIVSRVLDESHLLNIAVAPAFQRRGIAWAVLRELEQQCREKSSSVIYLEVRESNAAARVLYERLGYLETGLRKAYYRTPGGRENAVLMMLELTTC